MYLVFMEPLLISVVSVCSNDYDTTGLEELAVGEMDVHTPVKPG